MTATVPIKMHIILLSEFLCIDLINGSKIVTFETIEVNKFQMNYLN